MCRYVVVLVCRCYVVLNHIETALGSSEEKRIQWTLRKRYVVKDLDGYDCPPIDLFSSSTKKKYALSVKNMIEHFPDYSHPFNTIMSFHTTF